MIRVDTETAEIEYFHLMFSRHEIMLTNNLATESFFPGRSSLPGISDAARTEPVRILPELARKQAVYGPLAGPGLRTWEARVIEGRLAHDGADG